MDARDLTFDQAMEIGDRHGLTSVQTLAIWTEIRAKVDEAERRLEVANFQRCQVVHGDGSHEQNVALASLIVSVVNRERGQIEHARKQLALIADLRAAHSATTRELADRLESMLAEAWSVT